MSDKERIREVFSRLHAQENTITQVNNMISDEKRTGKHPAKRFPAAAAACLILLCAVTVYAAVHTDFFSGVFGTGVKGQEEFTVTLGDSGITEHYPSIERVAADEEKAEELTGAYVKTVGQSVTVGDYTFTIKDILMDENNIGAVTVHVENPNGLGFTEENANLETFGFRASTRSANLWEYMADRKYLITGSLTETDATYVYYLTPFPGQSADEDIIIRFRIRPDDLMTAEDYYASTTEEELEEIANAPVIDGYKDPADMTPEELLTAFGGEEEPWPEGTVTIPAMDRLSAKSFSADGLTAGVSPIGMMLSYEFEKGIEKSGKSITVKYTDGTEYVVMAENIFNAAEAFSPNFDLEYIAFNRLADPDDIAEIRVSGSCIDEAGTRRSFDRILTGSD